MPRTSCAGLGALLAVTHRAVHDGAHHLRIGVDGREGVEVVSPPATKAKPLGLDHHHPILDGRPAHARRGVTAACGDFHFTRARRTDAGVPRTTSRPAATAPRNCG